MPPRVYRGKSAYEWRPVAGGAVRLCKLDAPHSAVWAAYEQVSAEKSRRFDFRKLCDLYFAAADFNRLAPRTQDDYRRHGERVCTVFGASAPTSIHPHDVRRYMDLRGRQAETQANRERSFMQTVFAWGYERGLVKINPAVGVRPFREKPRDRYITDAEYAAVYAMAPPNLQAAMEISYRCAARQGDVLALLRHQLSQDGIYIKQGKTGKAQIKEWTVELRAAVDLALAQPLPPSTATMAVIHTRTGQKYTSSGFKTMWAKLMAEVMSTGAIAERFTFHDIKAKGISDFEGDKQRFSGHKTRAMVDTYDRKIASVATIGTPLKSGGGSE